MLRNFLPLLGMTFCICLFIVLMQFLWRYIDNLVGKGLGVDVIGELFFYAALTMVPMALPLAVLLASLMTFGNMGERLELTAMKSAGVSLLRTMLPLIWFMVALAIGAFFFQNDVLPVAQTKMWTLLYSMRQKQPELEIPEGTFYDQIPGYNIFVKEKDRASGMLREVMIYDLSGGFDNAMVILADSGRLAFTEDKTHLYLHLWEGESFENLRDAASRSLRNVPYRRETFAEKELTMPFDANFNRLDEEGMRNQYVGKDIARLTTSIDSLHQRIDSISGDIAADLRRRPAMDVPLTRHERDAEGRLVIVPATLEPQRQAAVDRAAAALDVDSVFSRGTASYSSRYLLSAVGRAEQRLQEARYRSITVSDEMRSVRRHAIELQRKFTLSLACIIFFFIGAPLGAIIRKGGLGVPIVISVVLFIFYYIIDNIGYKMAREGRVAVWEGIWLSSAVLLPLGVVLTWKAVNDSAVFNPDSYIAFMRRLTGRTPGRALTPKEVIIEPSPAELCEERLRHLDACCRAWLAAAPAAPSFTAFWLKPPAPRLLAEMKGSLEQTVETLADYPDKEIAMRLNDYPLLGAARRATLPSLLKGRRAPRIAMALLPLSVPVWLIGRRAFKSLHAETVQILNNNSIILSSIINNQPDSPTPRP